VPWIPVAQHDVIAYRDEQMLEISDLLCLALDNVCVVTHASIASAKPGHRISTLPHFVVFKQKKYRRMKGRTHHSSCGKAISQRSIDRFARHQDSLGFCLAVAVSMYFSSRSSTSSASCSTLLIRTSGSTVAWITTNLGFSYGRAALAAVILISGVSGAWAQHAAAPLNTAGSLEYRIEISRHERLLKTRKSQSARLAPFTSDGCSGGLSAGWSFVSSAFPAVARYHGGKPPWERCCLVHDRLYHAGGPSDVNANISFEARRVADEQLRQCVIQVGEERIQDLTAGYGLNRDQVTLLYRSIAEVMYRAVRLGGAPCTALPWRWGFGWPSCE
jgi:hypothetical protein